MPVITDRRSVAANAVVANVLSGSQYEFLPFDAVVEFGLTASAVALNATVTTGTDILMQDQEVSAQNRLPVYPDDFILSDVAAGGERLVVALRNTTGAAITAFTAVKITPV
jgi:hypothetical protein